MSAVLADPAGQVPSPIFRMSVLYLYLQHLTSCELASVTQLGARHRYLDLTLVGVPMTYLVYPYRLCVPI